MKVIVKIIQKANNKIFGIDVFVGQFFATVINFCNILPPENKNMAKTGMLRQYCGISFCGKNTNL